MMDINTGDQIHCLICHIFITTGLEIIIDLRDLHIAVVKDGLIKSTIENFKTYWNIFLYYCMLFFQFFTRITKEANRSNWGRYLWRQQEHHKGYNFAEESVRCGSEETGKVRTNVYWWKNSICDNWWKQIWHKRKVRNFGWVGGQQIRQQFIVATTKWAKTCLAPPTYTGNLLKKFLSCQIFIF